MAAVEPQLLTASPRAVRVEWPYSFDGNGALQWLDMIEQFFHFYGFTDPYRLKVAAIYFDGPVVPWFQELQQSRCVTSWASLKMAILVAAVRDSWLVSNTAEDAHELLDEMPESNQGTDETLEGKSVIQDDKVVKEPTKLGETEDKAASMGSTPVAEVDHLVLDELPEQDQGTAELIDEAAQIADIVLHSATQFMVRHTDVHGGCIGGPENLISIVCLYHNVVGGVSNPNAAYKIIEDHWCGSFRGVPWGVGNIVDVLLAWEKDEQLFDRPFSSGTVYDGGGLTDFKGGFNELLIDGSSSGFNTWTNPLSDGVDSSPYRDLFAIDNIEGVGGLFRRECAFQSEGLEPKSMCTTLEIVVIIRAKSEDYNPHHSGELFALNDHQQATSTGTVAEFATVRHQLEVFEHRLADMVQSVAVVPVYIIVGKFMNCIDYSPCEIAMQFSVVMRQSECKVDLFGVSSVISACSNLMFVTIGSDIHGIPYKIGLDSHVQVGSALVRLYGYAQYSNISEALHFFTEIPEKAVVSCTTRISGGSQQQMNEEAIQLFQRIQKAGWCPDQWCLVCALNACVQIVFFLLWNGFAKVIYDAKVFDVRKAQGGGRLAASILVETIHIYQFFFESKLGGKASSIFFQKSQQIVNCLFMFLTDHNTLGSLGDAASTPTKYFLKSMGDFCYFGDVGCFDKTFKVSDCSQPFTLFVSVHHHKLSRVFSTTVKCDERVETFKWLFETFRIATCGRQPKLMLIVCSVELRGAIAAFWPEDVIGSLLEYLDVPLLHDTNSDVSRSKGEGDDNNEEQDNNSFSEKACLIDRDGDQMEPLVPGLHSDGKFYVQGILEDNPFDNNTSGVWDSLVDLSTEKMEFGGTSNDIFHLVLLGKSEIQACQCAETLVSPYWFTLSFGCLGTDFGEPIQLAYIYLPSDHIDLKAAADAELTVADVTGIAEMTSMNVIPLMTEQLIALAVAIHDNIKEGGPLEIDTKLLHQFANGSGVILTSLAAILGGTVGQEVVKACSGKLHPLHQFFYFDSVESLSVYTLNPGEVEPKFCRYDDQIGVFGYKLQKKLEDAKVFIVGAGALGCEFLTNWALMGVCCSSKRKLTITDDDCSLICSVTTWGVMLRSFDLEDKVKFKGWGNVMILGIYTP